VRDAYVVPLVGVSVDAIELEGVVDGVEVDAPPVPKLLVLPVLKLLVPLL
jgi:hypothetical protein